MSRFAGDLVKGTTELLVLALLAEAELHGYALIQRLAERSGGRLRMNEGALYPLLHRLAAEKKLAAHERLDGRRSRKTYRITAAGRRALGEARAAWRAYADFVDALTQPTKEEA